MKNEIENIGKLLNDKSAEEILQLLAAQYPKQVIFSTSFGYEDQVLSHFIFSNDLPIEVFTLDTGRIFNETYAVWNSTLNRYKKPIKVYAPITADIEKLSAAKGPYSFYESIENRKECCYIRKVEPLKRALKGYQIWITGIRAEQSGNRKDMKRIEWDESNQIIKIHQ